MPFYPPTGPRGATGATGLTGLTGPQGPAGVPNPEAVHTVGTAGTSQTLAAVATATVNVLTLDQASCAITPPAAAAGASFTLVLIQGSGGSKAVTWVGTVDYPNKATPVLSTAAGAVDILAGVCYNGSTWTILPVAVNVGH